MDTEFNLEKNLKRIEEIAKLLEVGNINLDESLKLYEEGIKLSKLCMDELEKAKGKITEINKVNGEEEEYDGK